MKEDKQKICNALLPALQLTNSFKDLQALEYDEKNGIVYAKYPGSIIKPVCVDGFSGIGMIQNIIYELA